MPERSSQFLVRGLNIEALHPVTGPAGSLTGLLTSSGTHATATTCTPYGTPSTTNLTASAPAPSIGYAGSCTLPGSTGVDDMRARDYNPATSAFTSTDPL